MPDQQNGDLENRLMEWIKLALGQLENNSRCLDDIQKDIHRIEVSFLKEIEKIRVEVKGLKVKSSLWGAAAGAIPAAIALIFLIAKGQ